MKATSQHPNVIGAAAIVSEDVFMFNGVQYISTGKEGNSFYDQTPVAEYRSDDDHRVWKDAQNRVHAD